MIKRQILIVLLGIALFNYACDDDINEDPQVSEESIYTLPVVVHIVHTGEQVGEGYNLSNHIKHPKRTHVWGVLFSPASV